MNRLYIIYLISFNLMIKITNLLYKYYNKYNIKYKKRKYNRICYKLIKISFK